VKRSVKICVRRKEKKSEIHSSNGDFTSITHAHVANERLGEQNNLVNQMKLEDGTSRSRECSVHVTSV